MVKFAEQERCQRAKKVQDENIHTERDRKLAAHLQKEQINYLESKLNQRSRQIHSSRNFKSSTICKPLDSFRGMFAKDSLL